MRMLRTSATTRTSDADMHSRKRKKSALTETYALDMAEKKASRYGEGSAGITRLIRGHHNQIATKAATVANTGVIQRSSVLTHTDIKNNPFTDEAAAYLDQINRDGKGKYTMVETLRILEHCKKNSLRLLKGNIDPNIKQEEYESNMHLKFMRRFARKRQGPKRSEMDATRKRQVRRDKKERENSKKGKKK